MNSTQDVEVMDSAGTLQEQTFSYMPTHTMLDKVIKKPKCTYMTKSQIVAANLSRPSRGTYFYKSHSPDGYQGPYCEPHGIRNSCESACCFCQPPPTQRSLVKYSDLETIEE